jgi:hypothetical protein
MYANNSSSSNDAHGHDEENSRKISCDLFISRSQTVTTLDIIMFAYTYRSQFTTKAEIISAYKGILSSVKEYHPDSRQIIQDMEGHLKDKLQMSTLSHFAEFIKRMNPQPKAQTKSRGSSQKKSKVHSNPVMFASIVARLPWWVWILWTKTLTRLYRIWIIRMVLPRTTREGRFPTT